MPYLTNVLMDDYDQDNIMKLLGLCLLLLEVTDASSSGSLSFHVHLRSMWELFPLKVATCVPLLNSWPKEMQIVFKKSIWKRMHNHFSTNIFFWFIFQFTLSAFEVMCKVGCFFYLPLNVFRIALPTRLILEMSHYFCN